MAPPPADLRAIGLEGFSVIEKCYGQGGRRGRWGVQAAAAPGRQGQWVAQAPIDEMEEPCINSRDAASYYAGINIVNYYTSKGKPHQNRWGKSVKN